jgi:hypothetical protein
MKRILALAAALALATAGVGWYLGWFQVHTTPESGGHRTVNIDINTDKVNKDLHKGEDEVIQQGKEKLDELMEKNAKEVIGQTLPPLPGATEPGKLPAPALPGSSAQSDDPGPPPAPFSVPGSSR